MKKLSSRAKKILIVIAVLIGIILWSFPWIAEYYLEKKDVEWFGREVEVSDIDLNLITGKIALYNGFIYEKDGSTPFIQFETFETNIRLLSFLKSVFELEYVQLTNPRVVIIQTGSSFNFDDLIPEETEDSDTTSSEAKYLINDILLENGIVEYRDTELSSLLELDRINIEIPHIAYNDPVIGFIISATQTAGGDLMANGSLNLDTEVMNLQSDISDWQLRPYKNYLNSYLAIQDFAGLFNLELNVKHYLKNNDIEASAHSSIENFMLVDNNSDSLITWNSFEIFIDSVNTTTSLYDLGIARLVRPQVIFRYFEEGDSFSRLLLDTTSVQTLDTVRVASNEIVFQNPFQYLAEYLYYLVDEEVLTTYGADSMVLDNGKLTFVDYSHLQDATIIMDQLEVTVPRVSPEDSTLFLEVSSKVNQTASLTGELMLFRSGLSNLNLKVNLSDFYISAFDPYSRYYTAFPIWDGKMDLSSTNDIRDYKLKSDNNFFIEQIDIGKKLDIESEYKIPLRFAVSLLKDVNGNVDLEIPIEGDLNDPEYKVGKVILKVIMNLLSKAVASPYNMLARAFDADEEDLKSIRFENDQDSLSNPQTRSMDLTARILENKTDLKVKIEFYFNEKAERDAVALKYAKQKFISDLGDSLKNANWTDISDKDSVFVQYLNEKVGGLGTRPVAAMCAELVGVQRVDDRVAHLKSVQQELVTNYLFTEKGLDATRAEIAEGADAGRKSTFLQPTFVISYDVTDIADRPETSGPTAAENSNPADSVQMKPSD